MAAKNPLARVKEQFKDKASLVAAVEKLAGTDLWVARTNKEKGLAHVSNAKLLRLHATFTEVKAQFGTRDKLVAAVLELAKRTKDTGLHHKLSEWPVPRLFDAYRSAKKRAAVASGGAAARSKKAAAAPAKAAPGAKAAKAAKAPKAAADKPTKKA
ncbi:MAG: hypothetical protein ACRENE_33360 [Polyangiaceae bacterium]